MKLDYIIKVAQFWLWQESFENFNSKRSDKNVVKIDPLLTIKT